MFYILEIKFVNNMAYNQNQPKFSPIGFVVHLSFRLRNVVKYSARGQKLICFRKLSVANQFGCNE